MWQGTTGEQHEQTQPAELPERWLAVADAEGCDSFESQQLYVEIHGALQLLRGLERMPSWERRIAAWEFARELEQVTSGDEPADGAPDWAGCRLRDGLWEAQESQRRAHDQVAGARRAAAALMTALVAATSRELARLESKLGQVPRLSWRDRLRDANCELGRRTRVLWRAHCVYARGQLSRLFDGRKKPLRRRISESLQKLMV